VGMGKAFEILQKLTGSTFMSHLGEFSTSLFEVQEKFTVNLKKISSLLASEKAGFVIVSAPTPEMVPEIEHFIETLVRYHFHFDGIILNRTFGYLLPAHDPQHYVRAHTHTQADTQTHTKTDALKAGMDVIQALQRREAKIIEHLLRLPRITGNPICAKLPELARDVHSVEDLLHVAMAFSSSCH